MLHEPLSSWRSLAVSIRVYDPAWNWIGGVPPPGQLGTVRAKTQEFAGARVSVSSVTWILHDGADESSVRAKPADVKAIVRDMQSSEGHIVAAMGIDDGHTSFRDVFRAMGIDDRWILTPKNDPASIRRAFQLFSQSAIRASQGGGAFSKTAAGGFASP